MPAVPAEVYRRRRIGIAVLALCLVTVLALAGYLLVGADPAPGRDRTATAPTLTPQLPPGGEPGPVLSGDAGSEPVPDPDLLAAALAPELTDPRLGGRVIGLIVDPATGTPLFASDPDRLVVPASTAKLTTALAVELAVPPELRLPTRVVRGQAPGQVVLVGGGDVTLSSDAEGNRYAGAATMAELAAQVATAAGGPVQSVVVDAGLFGGPPTGPGWGAGDAPSSYAAPITAVMVDAGRLAPLDEGLRSGEPALAAGQALATELGVPGVPVTPGTAPVGAPMLGEVASAPVERLVEQMLAMSDNVLAEALARQVALATGQVASFDGAAAAVRTALTEAGFDLGDVVLVDGSGLSVDNRLTPRLLADILLRAVNDPAGPGRALLAGLPVAGYDGTLGERFETSPAGGVVRAKTGTLDGVSALAGVVQTADGRLLVFALVADQVPIGGRYPAEAALDEVATVLAGCGCR